MTNDIFFIKIIMGYKVTHNVILIPNSLKWDHYKVQEKNYRQKTKRFSDFALFTMFLLITS
jgi:hypothetical protein